MLSRHAHPQDQIVGSGPVACVGTCTGSTVSTDNDCSHWLDYFYVPYLLTASPFYLEQNFYSASFCLATTNPGQGTYQGNGFYAFYFPNFGDGRGWGWTMLTVGHASFVALDGSAEQSYYTSSLNSNLEIMEGALGITGTNLTPSSINPSCTSYNYTTANRWDWGHCTYMAQCTNVGASCPNLITSALHSIVPGECVSGTVNATVAISAATAGNPTKVTTSSNHNYGGGEAVVIWGATGNWTSLNGEWSETNVDATDFTIPLNSTGFGAFSGTAYTTDQDLDSTNTTDYEKDWMNNMIGVALGHLRELAYPAALSNAVNVSNALFQRLEEIVLDSTYNPYLVSGYLVPAKNGGASCNGITSSANPFLPSWAAVKNAFTPYMQPLNTFDHTNGNVPNFPCADHGYSLLARAAGSFLEEFNLSSSDANCPGGVCTAVAAWNWLNGHVPYFSTTVAGSASCSGDSHIKFALAPRAVVASSSTPGISGSTTISGKTTLR